MATYKEIKGVTVQTRDEDPVVNVGSWASGGDLNDQVEKLVEVELIQTSNYSFWWLSAYPRFGYEQRRKYNGSSWTEVADLNTAGRNLLMQLGTASAAVLFLVVMLLVIGFVTFEKLGMALLGQK